jgi:hypothetical protein
MTETQFAKGINIKGVNTQYGEILKLGINTTQLFDNPVKETGWLNLDLKKSKNGKWYAVINEFQKEQPNNQNVIDEDEIPF